jgi:predicted nucleic acid-binding protein
MNYLVDANVLSEATRPRPTPKVLQWLTSHESDLLIDAIILAELRFGILLLPSGRKRSTLEDWFEKLEQTIECLPWDRPVAARWAELLVDLRKRGVVLPVLDSMIAATALYHNLAIATRNERDFERAGVRVFNPFEI